MLIKLDVYKIISGEIVATNYIVTNSPQRAMEMINVDVDVDADVVYHICNEAEERAFWASQMGQSTSTAKATAARENGRKGGRPRKTNH